MMKKKSFSIVLLVLAALVLALAPAASAASVIYSTGFESGDYTGSATGIALDPINGDENSGQDGWISQWGGGADDHGLYVHTYAGNQVAFPVEGMDPQTIPTNPNGGAQFVADHAGNVSDAQFFSKPSGEVEFSIDHYAGPQYDNSGSFNSAFLPRDGGDRIAGWYTCKATSEVGASPVTGPWSPGFLVWNANGDQLMQGPGTQGYTFKLDEYAGFDELDRDSWYRLGVVVDWASGRITAIKSQKLQPGEPVIVVNNPLGWDASADDGAGAYVPLYAKGGTAGTSTPDNVRLYDVGQGTLTSFDNVYIGDAYDWSPIPLPPAVAIYATGFEPEDYTGSATGITIEGQDSWVCEWGGDLHGMWVHTYADNQVAFPKEGMDPQTVPTNPNGGDQFAADHQGNVKDVRSFDNPSGVVELSVDYYAGPQYDNNGNYNSGCYLSGGGTTITGWTACKATSEVGEPDPVTGPWSPGFRVYNADGIQLTQIGPRGYTFGTDEYAGFDELDRDSWYRLGVVVDLTTRRITTIKSQRLQPGETAIVVKNPVGWDASADDGAGAFVPLYAMGGEDGTLLPDTIVMYDVGAGSLMGYDNAYVGTEYDWPQILDGPQVEVPDFYTWLEDGPKTVTIDTAVINDPDGTYVPQTYTWSVSSASPTSGATFNPGGPDTTHVTDVTFDVVGDYVLQLEVDDNAGNIITGTVNVTVYADRCLAVKSNSSYSEEDAREKGDTNYDCEVNLADFADMASNWMTNVSF